MSGGISPVTSEYRSWSAVRPGADLPPEIDTLGTQDVAAAVTLYRQAFPTAFFGRLGRGFLAEYYAAIRTSPAAVALAVRVGGTVVAVLVGSVDACAHRRHVLSRHGGRLAVKGVAGLLARPHLALSFVRHRLRWYVRRLARGGQPVATGGPAARPEPVAVLDHVVVSPSARGSGIGRLLVERFMREAGERGATRAVLVTRAENTPARGLYERLGWVATGEHDTRDGSRVVTYEYPLGSADADLVGLPATGQPAGVSAAAMDAARHSAGAGESSRRSTSAAGSGGANR